MEISGADIRRKVIEQFLGQLMQQQPHQYYASASEIARTIHQQLQNRLNTFDFDEQKQLKTLDIHDIEVILSFKK